MSVRIHIPTPMRQHTDGQAVVEVSGSNVQGALEDLGRKHSGITPRIFDNGQVRRFVNLYLNDEDIRYLDNLATAVKDGDELSIIPAVAGGGMVPGRAREPGRTILAHTTSRNALGPLRSRPPPRGGGQGGVRGRGRGRRGPGGG